MNSYKLNGRLGQVARTAICKGLSIDPKEIYKKVKGIKYVNDSYVFLVDNKEYELKLTEVKTWSVIESKSCFNCKQIKPLNDFQIETGYSRPAELGRSICCRECNIDRALKQGGYLTKASGKFEFIEASEEEIIKHMTK